MGNNNIYHTAPNKFTKINWKRQTENILTDSTKREIKFGNKDSQED
jgi:hypothetical protein